MIGVINVDVGVAFYVGLLGVGEKVFESSLVRFSFVCGLI